MTNQLPTHILNHLLNNEEYCRRVVPYLKNEYFEGTHKTVFDLIVNFVSKHNKLPTSKILELELKKINAPEDVLNNASRLVNEIAENQILIQSIYLMNQKSGAKRELSITLSWILYKSLMVKTKNEVKVLYLKYFRKLLEYHLMKQLVMIILITQTKGLNFIIEKKIVYHLI